MAKQLSLIDEIDARDDAIKILRGAEAQTVNLDAVWLIVYHAKQHVQNEVVALLTAEMEDEDIRFNRQRSRRAPEGRNGDEASQTDGATAEAIEEHIFKRWGGVFARLAK